MDAGFPDPGIVGKMFVKQYYTTMHRDASQLHRFYLEQSSFVHGGSEMGSEDPVVGQKSIHDKIESLALKQVHAKIKQVDSHATLGSGIVVQVTGELSISGHPMRAFVQTFVLAPESPKKYYVHNDIFRYQDDDLAESEINEPAGDGEPAALMEDEDGVENNGDYQGTSSLSSSEGGKLVGGANQEMMMFSTQQPLVGGENPAITEVEPELPPKSDEWETIQYVDMAHVQQNGIPESLEAPPTAEEEYPMEDTSSAPAGGEQPIVERFSPQDMHKDQKLSWAGRLAKQPQGTSQNRPLNSTSVSTSQALPQREPRVGRRTGGGGGSNDFSKATPPGSGSQVGPPAPGMNTGNTSREPKKGSGVPYSQRDTPDSCQIFVGGLPSQTSEAEIRGAFKDYEPIKEVRVNPKNFAFVIFENPDPVERIMKTKEAFTVRGKTLNIEPKKEKGSGPRGPFRGGDKFRGGAGGGMGGKPRANSGGVGGAAASGRNSKR